MTNDEPNKTFEISCSVTIPLCWGKEDAIQDFKEFVWRDELILEVKDVTEECEHELTFEGHKQSDFVKDVLESHKKNETKT